MFSTESILVIGGIAILTTLSINFSNSTVHQISTDLFNEAVFTATGIGQSMIEEIESRAFDENTVSSYVSTPAGLTTKYYLGQDSGESLSTDFDDIDDYHNFSKTDTLPRLGSFEINSMVYYVQRADPNIKTLYQTFAKRIEVVIINSYLGDTLTFNKLVTY